MSRTEFYGWQEMPLEELTKYKASYAKTFEEAKKLYRRVLSRVCKWGHSTGTILCQCGNPESPNYLRYARLMNGLGLSLGAAYLELPGSESRN